MQLTLFLHLRTMKAILVNEWSNTNWTKWTKWTEWNEFCEMSEQESDVARWGRNKVSCMAAFTNYLGLLFPFYCLWFKSVGFSLWRIFFCFLIWVFFFYFFAFGLIPSSLGYDGFFIFLIFVFFLHFIAFGFSPSGVVYDGFFFVFWFGTSSSIL